MDSPSQSMTPKYSSSQNTPGFSLSGQLKKTLAFEQLLTHTSVSPPGGATETPFLGFCFESRHFTLTLKTLSLKPTSSEIEAHSSVFAPQSTLNLSTFPA